MLHDPRRRSPASAVPAAVDPCIAFLKLTGGPFLQVGQAECYLSWYFSSGQKDRGVEADPYIDKQIRGW